MQRQKVGVIVSSVDMICYVKRADLRKQRPRIPEIEALKRGMAKRSIMTYLESGWRKTREITSKIAHKVVARIMVVNIPPLGTNSATLLEMCDIVLYACGRHCHEKWLR